MITLGGVVLILVLMMNQALLVPFEDPAVVMAMNREEINEHNRRAEEIGGYQKAYYEQFQNHSLADARYMFAYSLSQYWREKPCEGYT